MNSLVFGSRIIKGIFFALALFALAASFSSRAATLFWDADGNPAGNDSITGTGLGGTGTWDLTLANWYDGLLSDVTWNNLNVDNAVFTGTAGSVTLGAGITVGSLFFTNTGSYAISGNTLTFGAGGGTVDTGGGNHTIGSVIAGSVGLTKIGDGILTLTNANAYSGITTVSGGTLSISTDGNLGAIPGAPVANSITLDGGTLRHTGGTVTLNANRGITIGANGGTLDVASGILLSAGVISGPGVFTKTGRGDFRTYIANNTFSKLIIDQGAFTVGQSTNPGSDQSYGAVPAAFTADAITIRNGATNRTVGSVDVTISANRGITLGPGGGVFRNDVHSLTVQSVISGAGSLTKFGGQTLTLNGANTFTGDFTLLGGSVNLNTDTAAGLGNIIVTPTSSASTLRNNVASSTLANNITLNPGASTLDILATTGNTLTLNGVISGAGNWNRGLGGGQGNVILGGSSDNTFSGSLTIVQGILTAAKNAALGDVAGITTVNSGATLAFQGGINYSAAEPVSITGNGLGGIGAINNASGNNSFAGPVTLTGNASIGSASGALTLNGSIGESGGARTLSKVGSGTLTLAGANTYSGGTTISNGTLRISNTTGSATGTGALTVNSGTRLEGNGSVASAFILSGTIAPGTGVGKITTGSQNWNGGGTLQFEVVDASSAPGVNQDLNNIVGGLTIGSTPGSPFNIAVVSLAPGNTPGNVFNFDNTQPYNWTLATANGGITGFDPSAFNLDTSNFSNNLGGGSFSLGVANGNQDLQLAFTPVPEPATGLLLAGGAAAFLLFRRRRVV